ncbi:uncharacterized protein LOC119274358 isoform X1 [Triticum dicoccoides]|uniref:uncharacterized protein LOC119274358 isoform X1 n=1 Tax=Triticum dicoccoides TaxID=85692 RepID=UPI00188E6E06|nr:uncharacterized protein LOC119274358 isoform X1 [Triticum dicoccoides]XP_044343755.1 uncharacterized protein LOC123064323 isoform X1 [Triticum aestivum]
MAVGCRFPVRAEFADSLEHPDPVPLAVLPRRDVTPATPADSNAGSGCRQHVGCASPGRTQGENRCRRPGSPTRSAQSTHRVNPEAPGWTKRLHLGSAPPDRTPCPYRMSALEQSIRKYAPAPRSSQSWHPACPHMRRLSVSAGATTTRCSLLPVEQDVRCCGGQAQDANGGRE